ncbi:MAG: hypothetical protein WB626_12785 [Bacteroidota bacterium]
MKQIIQPAVLGVFVLCAGVWCAGCAHTKSSEATEIRESSWQAELDECREVRLSVIRGVERNDGEPERVYERLALEVRPRARLQFEKTLKSIELKPGVPEGQLRFDEIDVRADESRRRVWFVDRVTRRVVATLERDTGMTTGPDDGPPAWATPDGGVLLSGGK